MRFARFFVLHGGDSTPTGRPSNKDTGSSVDTSTISLWNAVALVPYLPQAVPTYHGWMQDAELREATASEPLSLEEEYEMCDSWATDIDKLTFLIAQRPTFERYVTPPGGDHNNNAAEGSSSWRGLTHELSRLVGDVNVFFGSMGIAEPGEPFEANDGRCIAPPTPSIAGTLPQFADSVDGSMIDYSLGELSVQVAEKTSRGSGLAGAATLLIMHFAMKKLGTRKFVAKINADNTASLRMFSDKLGFLGADEGPNVFGEVSLWRDVYGADAASRLEEDLRRCLGNRDVVERLLDDDSQRELGQLWSVPTSDPVVRA